MYNPFKPVFGGEGAAGEENSRPEVDDALPQRYVSRGGPHQSEKVSRGLWSRLCAGCFGHYRRGALFALDSKLALLWLANEGAFDDGDDDDDDKTDPYSCPFVLKHIVIGYKAF